MADPSNGSRTQAQIDSRENLFYFLQSLPKEAWPDGSKFRGESFIMNEQIETYLGRSLIVF